MCYFLHNIYLKDKQNHYIKQVIFLEVKNKIMHDPLEVSKANPSKAAFRYREQLGLNFGEKEATRETKPKERILRKLLNPAIKDLAKLVNKHLTEQVNLTS